MKLGKTIFAALAFFSVIATFAEPAVRSLRISITELTTVDRLNPEMIVSATLADGSLAQAELGPDGSFYLTGIGSSTTIEIDHPVLGVDELSLPWLPVDRTEIQVRVRLGEDKTIAMVVPSMGDVVPDGIGCGSTCPAGATMEVEPDCGTPEDTVNGGCNSDPPVFSPIACGETVCGTGASDGDFRDTDWYQVTVDSKTRFFWNVVSEFDSFTGILGSPLSCPAFPVDAASTMACDMGSTTTGVLEPGTYTFVVAPEFGDPVACGASYVATLTCLTDSVYVGTESRREVRPRRNPTARSLRERAKVE